MRQWVLPFQKAILAGLRCRFIDCVDSHIYSALKTPSQRSVSWVKMTQVKNVYSGVNGVYISPL